MSLRSLIPFLFLVFVVALGGTFLGLRMFGDEGASAADPRVQLVTVQVIITATPDPNAEPDVRVVTATPDRTQVALPPNILPDDDDEDADAFALAFVATLDPTIVGANPALGLTATSLPQNCILHTIEAGDTPFGVALEYGANPFLLLEANALTEQTAVLLQIGDTLIIPLEGCDVAALAEMAGRSLAVASEDDAEEIEEPEETAEPDSTAAPTATITLAPTATNAQIEIVGIEGAGDITREGVLIRNVGNTVNVTGWTLSDLDENEYTFNEQLIFSNTEVVIYTRVGQNTPIALYWGLDEAVWGDEGNIITLRDAQGNIQATARVGNVIDLE